MKKSVVIIFLLILIFHNSHNPVFGFNMLAPPRFDTEIKGELVNGNAEGNGSFHIYSNVTGDEHGLYKVRVWLKRKGQYYGEISVTITEKGLVIDCVKDLKLEIGGFKAVIIGEGMWIAYKEALKRNINPSYLIIANSYQTGSLGIRRVLKINSFFGRMDFHKLTRSKADREEIMKVFPEWGEWEDEFYYCFSDEIKMYQAKLISLKMRSFIQSYTEEIRNGHFAHSIRHLNEACDLFELYAHSKHEKREGEKFIFRYLLFKKYSQILHISPLLFRALKLFVNYGEKLKIHNSVRTAIVKNYFEFIMESDDDLVDSMLKNIKKLKKSGTDDPLVDIIISMLFLRKGQTNNTLSVIKSLKRSNQMSKELAEFVKNNIYIPAEKRRRTFLDLTKQLRSGRDNIVRSVVNIKTSL